MKHRNQRPSQSDDRTVVIGRRTEEAIWDDFHRTTFAIETPPAGALNAAQYAEKYDTTVECARSALARASRTGQFETGLFRVLDANGKGRHTRFWWPALGKRAA